MPFGSFSLRNSSDTAAEIESAPLNAFLHPLGRRSDVEIRYRIQAPRASKLIINHNNGGVNISGLSGDIHATVVNGQITLTRAAGARDAIDAQCQVGNVYSDFEGKDRSRHVLGEEFRQQTVPPAANVYLRVRLGDIVIVKQNKPPTG